MKKFFNILKSVLIIVAGIIGILLVNYVGTMILKSIFKTGISPDGIPLSENSIIAYLFMIFIAGIVGAFIITILIKQKPWIHLGVFCALAFISDTLAIQGLLVDFPVWAKIIVLVSIPIQIWLGGIIGLKIKKNTNSVAPQK